MPAVGAEIGDAALGAEVFKKECSKCHQVGEEARNRIGPQLNGIFGCCFNSAATNPMK